MASTSSLRDKRAERPIIRAVRALEQRIAGKYLLQLLLVFVVYLIAGKLGQATTNIRSSNLGPVWPAYGVALAAFLICGYRVWPAVGAAAFLIAFFSPVPHLAALGQAAGATVAAMTGAFLLRRIGFNRSLSRLSDALSLIALGGFGSAVVSASVGVLVLYATHVHAYSGLGPAWLIYWLGEATGVLLVTPLALRLNDFSKLLNRERITELATLLLLLAATCLVIFSDRLAIPFKLDFMAFSVLPFIIWAAIRFGVGVTALSILIVAAIATVETALGEGPFAIHTTFANAVLLDVFFAVLAVTGLSLAAVIAEREQAEREREQVVSKQAAIEARLEAAHELRLSEERWRLAAQAGKMYAYEWDVATDTVFRSGEVTSVLGPSGEAANLTRQGLLARVHSDDQALFTASVSERTPEKPDTQISYRVLRPDGSVIWLEKTAHAFFDEHGRMLRMVGMVSNITERKQAEERLREYEKVVEDTEEMIAVIDREYRYLIANRQFLKMRNMTREQVVGRSMLEVLNPGFFEAVAREKLDECFQGKVIRYETKYTYPGLGERDVLASYFPIEGVSGIDRVACILQDITDRKRAAEALRDSEDKLRLLLDSTAEAIYGVDVEGRCTVCNPAGVRARGYQSVDELLGRNMHYLIHHTRADGTSMPIQECRVSRAFRVGEGVHVDDEVLWRKDGTSFPAEYWSYPQRRGQEVVGAVVAFIDITDRKKAEKALHDMNRALETQTSVLQAREELLKIFVKTVPAGVAMLDRDMRYLQVSDRWCADYSIDSSQVLGRSHYELFPDQPKRWKQVHRRALEGETVRAEEDRWDREGGTMWVRWEVRPWRSGNGLPDGILIFAEDITRRKQMEQALSGMSRKLIEAQEQERTRIARDLHDDINQRLALLAIEIDRSKQNLPLSAEDTNRLLSAIWEDVVAVSSELQSISHQLHSSQLEFLGVVVAMKSFCQEFIARQKVQIDFTHDDIPVAVSRDVSLCLFRVLQEALHNAFKHSNTRHFKVKLGCLTNQLHLTVSDRGRGFDLETPSNKAGLGLISMRERVRLVNGTIVIESKPMGGTTIDVRVPLESEVRSQQAAG